MGAAHFCIKPAAADEHLIGCRNGDGEFQRYAGRRGARRACSVRRLDLGADARGDGGLDGDVGRGRARRPRHRVFSVQPEPAAVHGPSRGRCGDAPHRALRLPARADIRIVPGVELRVRLR